MRFFQICGALCMIVAGVAGMIYDPNYKWLGVAGVLVGFSLLGYLIVRRSHQRV
jgi:cell shape-determining protein MreD